MKMTATLSQMVQVVKRVTLYRNKFGNYWSLEYQTCLFQLLNCSSVTKGFFEQMFSGIY